MAPVKESVLPKGSAIGLPCLCQLILPEILIVPCGLSQQLPARDASDRGAHDLAFGLVGVEQNFGELLGPAHAGIFQQNRMIPSDLRRKVHLHAALTRIP